MNYSVDLQELIEALDLQSEFLLFFLDQTTGEIITLTNDEVSDVLACKKEEDLLFAQEVLSSPRYLKLPNDLDKKSLMTEFCNHLEDKEMAEALLEVTHEENAFARFNVAAHFHQIEEEWLVFIQDKLKKVAIDWCIKHHISYVDAPREEMADWL